MAQVGVDVAGRLPGQPIRESVAEQRPRCRENEREKPREPVPHGSDDAWIGSGCNP